MDKVLIVENDADFFEALKKGLSKLQQFDIFGAGNIQEAIETLSAHRIDVVVAGLGKQASNTLELLSYLSRNHPKTPCIVISDQGKPWFSNRQAQESFLYYLEKPFQIATLASSIVVGLNIQDMGTNIWGMRVSSLLPLIEMAEMTCHIKFDAFDRRKGDLYFCRGMLLDATCGSITGEAAAREIAGWNRIAFEIDELPENRRIRRIHAGNMEIAGATWIRSEAIASADAHGMRDEIIVLEDVVEMKSDAAEPIILLLDYIEDQDADKAQLVEAVDEFLKQLLVDIRRVKGYQGAMVVGEYGEILADDESDSELGFAAIANEIPKLFFQARNAYGTKDTDHPEALTLHTPQGILLVQHFRIKSNESIFVIISCSTGGNWYYINLRLKQAPFVTFAPAVH